MGQHKDPNGISVQYTWHAQEWFYCKQRLKQDCGYQGMILNSISVPFYLIHKNTLYFNHHDITKNELAKLKIHWISPRMSDQKIDNNPLTVLRRQSYYKFYISKWMMWCLSDVRKVSLFSKVWFPSKDSIPYNKYQIFYYGCNLHWHHC